MYRTLPYLGLFAAVALLQVFLFDNLTISIYLNPLVYIVFIALLPLDTPPAAVLGARTGAGRHDGLRHGRGGDQHDRHAADRLPAPDPGRHDLRPRQRPRRGHPLVGASGRTKAHHLPRGADARASRRILFAGGPFVDPTRSIRCCASSSARRYRRASSGSSPASSPPKSPCAYEKLREFHADAHPASHRPADLRADRRTAGLHPALRFALRRSGARQRAAPRRAVPAARRGLRPQRRISGAEPRMLRPDGHIERNRQTGLRHGPHVRRAGTFARPARTRTGQRADASGGRRG